jgi:hypothetical protein
MEELLSSTLLADSPLYNLVSNRITWNTRPQLSAVPAIVLTKVSSIRDYHMAGSSGLVTTRVQVDCWALTFASAVAVARAVRVALSGSTFSDSGVEVQGAFLDGERHFFEEATAERFHRVSLDFEIWHSE